MEQVATQATWCFPLTESFRFGPGIAMNASIILHELKDDPVALSGGAPSTDKPTNFAVLAGTSAKGNWDPFVPKTSSSRSRRRKSSSTPQVSWSGSTSSPDQRRSRPQPPPGTPRRSPKGPRGSTTADEHGGLPASCTRPSVSFPSRDTDRNERFGPGESVTRHWEDGADDKSSPSARRAACSTGGDVWRDDSATQMRSSP
jgi:hypothetical protein